VVGQQLKKRWLQEQLKKIKTGLGFWATKKCFVQCKIVLGFGNQKP